ncbi:hypothetical protein F4561_000604 [Lipingzhangella halophila]|uniref:DUF3352 domain-containing protein n=1 Tax=Lipingzhangella halophila TaxID=1783352 RepID=A0A7W7RD71_9ACTN|nr:DUF3352 domain-containing protein [Lipingzhangella halophila]MBB4929784.1 hypothetical protein [Lipingzhangella halophila]
MSYPDPPNQPPWMPPGQQPGGPPPQGMAYAQPQYGAPRKRRTWLIPVAGVVGVALMASTVWAANYAMDDLFGGPQPETAMPASSVMFAKLDLKPSGGQLANYAQFVNKLPDELKDEVDPEADPAEPIFDDGFLEDTGLNYEDDIEPWFGQRFGAAAWPAEDEEAAADESGMAFAVTLAVEDEEAADAALSDLSSEFEEFHYDFYEDFAVLSNTSAALDEHAALLEDGSLADEDTFTSDMDSVGSDSLAAAWLDLDGFSDLAEDESGSSPPSTDPFDDPYSDPSDPFSDPGDPYSDPSDPFGGPSLTPGTGFEEASGRMAMALKIESDYVELRGDMFEVTVDGVSMSDYEVDDPGIGVLGELPDDTVMAAGGNNLEQWVTQAYEADPEAFDEGGLTDGMEELGAAPPEGFADLLGTQTAFGITDFDGMLGGESFSADPSYQYRATGADEAILEDLVTQMSEGSYGSSPGVDSDGDTAVVSYGSTGTGKLADDEVYQQTMQDMEGATVGFYLDARAIAEDSGTEGADQYGGVGGSMSLDGDNASLQARWAPTGG